MVDPAQKTHRPSRGQAIHLPNHASIMIKPCWSGIVKKWKEKISFSIRKLLTSWHNAINAKNTLKTYFFWPTQPFRMPQSTAYALFFSCWWKHKRMKKRVIFHWVSNGFMRKNDGKKNLKKWQSNLPSDFKTVRSYCPTRGKLSATCNKEIQERKKQYVRETINVFIFLCHLPSSWWIVLCHHLAPCLSSFYATR